MSKFVKEQMTREISHRLNGVDDALLVNVIGLTANKTVALRRDLREKDIHLLVVKESMARLATSGTRLARAFEKTEGSVAVIWGGEDFISLAKEVTRLDKSNEYEQFQARGGVMDGEPLTADRVREISKWPNRLEQLSILSGQLLSPGAQLSSQLLAPGGALASQIEKKGEESEPSSSAEAGAEALAEAPVEAAVEGEAEAGS